MSQYIVLERVSIQNANAIGGFTWGFPAITNFLGFTHALSRKIPLKHNVNLAGCGVVSHEHQTHTYQPYSNYEFIQQKCPAKGKKVVNPPIIEEGKMNLTVSLIIAVDDDYRFKGAQADHDFYEKEIESLCYQQRLAGGTILSIQSVTIYSGEEKNILNKIKRLLMPGFILMDQSSYLEQRFLALQKKDNSAELLDAWLDFSTLKYKATPILKEDEKITEKTKANWEVQPKPFTGWLVPIMTGYKAISEVYPAGDVGNVRDEETNTCFVEPVHSIGEWKGFYRIEKISDCIWKYEYDKEWYLCKQDNSDTKTEAEPESSLSASLNEFFENF